MQGTESAQGPVKDRDPNKWRNKSIDLFLGYENLTVKKAFKKIIIRYLYVSYRYTRIDLEINSFNRVL